MKKTLAMVDTIWAGHHPIYFKLFCTIAIDCGHKVFALSPAEKEMTAWKNQKKYTSDQIEILSCSEIPPINFPIHFVGILITSCKRWLNVKTALKGINPDLVFFPWLDNYLSFFLFPLIHKLIFPFAWSGIYFHPRYLRIKDGNKLRQKVRESAAMIFKSDKCIGVGVLDEGVSSSLRKLVGEKPIIVLPDVADDSEPASDYSVINEIKAKAKNRKIVLLAGGLAKRKGIFTLLKAAQNCYAEDLFFVFAGRLIRSTFSQEELMLIDQLASEPPDNCFFIYNEIPEEVQLNALIAVCNVLFACYNDFPHSSNMLTKATLFKKPIIVSNRFCMGERVEKFGIGITIAEGDSKGCLEAIRHLTDHMYMIEDICFEKYREANDINKFRDAVVGLLSLH